MTIASIKRARATLSPTLPQARRDCDRARAGVFMLHRRAGSASGRGVAAAALVSSPGVRGVPAPSVRRSAVRASVAGNKTDELLDSFWLARGVFNNEQRGKLVEAAAQIPSGAQRELDASGPLPGVPATWSPDSAAPEVLEVSRRLVQLQQLLGSGQPASTFNLDRGSKARTKGVDVTWMVVREPGLLTADYGELIRRLVDMKTLTAGSDVDVLQVVEKSPALLLSDSWQQGLAAIQRAGDATSNARDGTVRAAASDATVGTSAAPKDTRAGIREVVKAWEFGLPSDCDDGWEVKLKQLGDYKAEHGDAHVGFRDGDDLELSRWAKKQRTEATRGEMDLARRERLSAMGFEFNADEAEFQRWFAELATFKATSGHCHPNPLSTHGDLYLMHWCSVQRIALRNKRLSAAREAQLTELGFDWSGADPLS